MSDFSEAKINQFIKTYPYPFTTEALRSFIEKTGNKISYAECKEFLCASPYVFELQKDVFLTRAGAFLGKKFSIKPTQEEIEKKMFVIGHRCVPYANPEVVSSTFTFSCDGKPLPEKVGEFDSNSALKFFLLYGEEYASQYIAADFANQSLNLAKLEFELPPKVFLTGVSLEPLMKKCNFRYGDRLLCKVEDWDSGFFSVEPILSHEHNLKIKDDDVKRQEWFDTLEKILLHALDTYGPLSSIDEQLANAVFDFQEVLSKDYCGSIEEFMQQTDKIGFENYGVETRLWHKGEDVPAVGKWSCMRNGYTSLIPEEWFPNFAFMVDTYIKDCLFQKSCDFSMLDEFVEMVPDRHRRKQAENLIEERKKILSESYNWFADYTAGGIRHRALELYKKVEQLLDSIESGNASDLSAMPQQEMVVLTQLYIHLVKILETTESQADYISEEYKTIMLSIDGMEMNFEDIKPIICNAKVKQDSKRFRLIK